MPSTIEEEKISYIPSFNTPSSAQILLLAMMKRTHTVFDTTNVAIHTYTSSLLYLLYWYHRSANNRKKQEQRLADIRSYIGDSDTNGSFIQALISDIDIRERANEFVKNSLKPTPTVDLVIMKKDSSGKDQILTIERKYYPLGCALPGGIIREEDESNLYNMPESIYAALRVTGEKVLWVETPSYGIWEQEGKKYYYVQGSDSTRQSPREARIFFQDTASYTHTDRLSHITSPSDPRHMVHTTAYKIEVVWEDLDGYHWVDAEDFIRMDAVSENVVVFPHHKEIVAHIVAQSMEIPRTSSSHHDWIRQTVSEPKNTQDVLRERFRENNNDPDTPTPELYPLVETMRSWLSADRTEQIIQKNPALWLMREQLHHKLDLITIKNGLFCPYATTIRLLFEVIGFFDICCRGEKNYSTHFQKKYWHRYHDLMSKIPDLLLIPTPENISATDLMRVRATSLGFIWLSADSIYVDEFWQSPLEFLIHDLNHFWKMRDADERYVASHPGETLESLYARSSQFGRGYLDSIKIQKEDPKETRELKKLKKIILFEVIHEDARPFLPDVIAWALLESEGYPIEDDMIVYKEGKPVRVVHTYPGITALSYVRHKLQHGFFDQTDAQNINIVDPAYRSVEWIVRAAREMLDELWASIPQEIEEEWLDIFLSRQASSRGPDILQEWRGIDPAVTIYGDGSYDGMNVAI
jgi:hypothetical protein